MLFNTYCKRVLAVSPSGVDYAVQIEAFFPNVKQLVAFLMFSLDKALLFVLKRPKCSCLERATALRAGVGHLLERQAPGALLIEAPSWTATKKVGKLIQAGLSWDENRVVQRDKVEKAGGKKE